MPKIRAGVALFKKEIRLFCLRQLLVPKAVAEIGILAICGLLCGAPAHAQTLYQLIEQARQVDPQLAAAEAASQARSDGLNQERSRFLPHLGLDANWQTGRDEDAGHRASAYRSRSANLALRQTLFNMGDWQSLQQSKLGVDMAAVQTRQIQQNVRLRLSLAYFDALVARQDVALLNAREATLRKLGQAVKRRFEEGRATVIDTSAAHAELQAVLSLQVGAQADLDIATSQLSLLSQCPLTQLAEPDPRADDADLSDGALARWQSAARAQDFEVQKRALAADIAAREVLKAKGDFLPTVQLVGSYGASRGALTTSAAPADQQTGRAIGVNLSVPLFDGLGTRARVDQASHLVLQAKAELAQAQREADLEATRNFLAARASLAQIKASQAALDSASLAYEAVVKGFQFGKRSMTEVGIYEDRLFQARRNLSRAKYAWQANLVKLRASTAQLDDAYILRLSRGAPEPRPQRP